MKLRTLTFVTALALSSSLAFAQGGGGGGGGTPYSVVVQVSSGNYGKDAGTITLTVK